MSIGSWRIPSRGRLIVKAHQRPEPDVSDTRSFSAVSIARDADIQGSRGVCDIRVAGR